MRNTVLACKISTYTFFDKIENQINFNTKTFQLLIYYQKFKIILMKQHGDIF